MISSLLLQLFPLFFWTVWIHSHQVQLGSNIWLKEWRIQGLRHEAVTPENLYAIEHFHLLTYDLSQKTYGCPRMPVQVSKCRWVLRFNIYQPNTLNKNKSKMSNRPKSCFFPTDFCVSGHGKKIFHFPWGPHLQFCNHSSKSLGRDRPCVLKYRQVSLMA